MQTKNKQEKQLNEKKSKMHRLQVTEAHWEENTQYDGSSDKEEGRTIYTPRSNQGLETNKQMKVIKTT